jgi:retinol dehydrogenase-12
MKGKTCLITGATSGIGKETALALARLGATVVFTARDEERGKAVKREIIDRSGSNDIDFIFCDLSSLQSVKECSQIFRSSHKRLDVLINDAGTWEREKKLSKDGIELTFAVNHLAHFLLTNLLLDTMKASAPSRVIGVTSGLHSGTINFEDIGFERKFRGIKAYRQSKLAVILFTRELARRLQGTSVTANCLMPGVVDTGLSRNSRAVSRAVFKLIATTPEKGARTSIYLASSPEVEKVSGECFSKSRVVKASKESNDPELAKRLWEVSVGYVQNWL